MLQSERSLPLAGEFAEAVRDQFLNERIEYYKELEDAIAKCCSSRRHGHVQQGTCESWAAASGP